MIMMRKTEFFVIIITAVVIFAGCKSSEQFYRQAKLSREQAYHFWQSRKQREQYTQTIIKGKLPVKDCLKLALNNNKRLQSVLQEKEIARGQEVASYAAILPSIGLSSEYLRKDQISGLGPITFGDFDNYSIDLQVTQPLFAGGSISAQLNAGKLFSLLADQTVRKTVQDVILQAANQYYQVLLEQHLREISEDAVRLARAQLDDARKKRQAGVASDFDVLRAQVELSNFEAELIQNKNTVNVAKAQLVKIMGVSQDSSFELSDELTYQPFDIPMTQAVEVAYQNRPELFRKQLNIELQKQQLAIAHSSYWPTISGFYTNSWSRPDPHKPTVVDWGHLWNAGFSANLPVFDGLQREGNIIQQKARLKQAQVDLVDTEETVLFELKRAILSIQDATEFVESQALNLERAKEGLRLAEVGYKQGTKTQVETIDAQSALTKAKGNYYHAIHSHIAAKLELQRAMGTIAQFQSLNTGGQSDDAPRRVSESRLLPNSSQKER